MGLKKKLFFDCSDDSFALIVKAGRLNKLLRRDHKTLMNLTIDYMKSAHQLLQDPESNSS